MRLSVWMCNISDTYTKTSHIKYYPINISRAYLLQKNSVGYYFHKRGYMGDRFDTVHDEESIGEELCPICDGYYRPFISGCDCERSIKTKAVPMKAKDVAKWHSITRRLYEHISKIK